MVWRSKPLLSVALRPHSYLSGGFTIQKLLPVSVLRKKVKKKKEKTKAVCSLGRTNYGGLRNVLPPIIDPLYMHSTTEKRLTVLSFSLRSFFLYLTRYLSITTVQSAPKTRRSPLASKGIGCGTSATRSFKKAVSAVLPTASLSGLKMWKAVMNTTRP